MIFPERERSPGQEAGQETLQFGPKTNQIMLEMKTVRIHLALDTTTSGMT